MDGLLIIDKPPGLTSHDVVAQARRILRERRVGHTGTLDPFATGVLVLLLGRATRLAQFISDSDKEYEAVIRFGYATDTGDITGAPLQRAEDQSTFSESEIERALDGLRGNILQVPPMYSAKKKEGRKLYELAKLGIEVERAPVPVCIFELETIRDGASLLKSNHDGTADLKVRVVCSAGTYIRTLAEDIGKLLNTGAHLAELRRTRAGRFSLDSAVTLQQLKATVAEESLGTIIQPPQAALSGMPFLHLNAQDEYRVRNGVVLQSPDSDWPAAMRIGMLDEAGNLIGVAYFDADKRTLHPRVVLPT